MGLSFRKVTKKKNEKLVSQEIANVIDLFEQIESVNQIIKIHEGDDDNFMLNQYRYRKQTFLEKLKEILQRFDISPMDLAA